MSGEGVGQRRLEPSSVREFEYCGMKPKPARETWDRFGTGPAIATIADNGVLDGP